MTWMTVHVYIPVYIPVLNIILIICFSYFCLIFIFQYLNHSVTCIFQGMGQRKVTSFHALDALFLFGKDVRNLHFNERYVDLLSS